MSVAAVARLFETLASEAWEDVFRTGMGADDLVKLADGVEGAWRSGRDIYPPKADLFAAFNAVEPSDVGVVILGQDPYHGEGQAHGLSFSVPVGVKPPPSLRNILKEVSSDVGETSIPDGNLMPWARQGVLLLNSVLTVEASNAASHRRLGWQALTHTAIRALSELNGPIVFLLWGNDAQHVEGLIDAERHHVLKAVHPSPLSSYRGFFGCRHFSKANALLRRGGRKEIRW